MRPLRDDDDRSGNRCEGRGTPRDTRDISNVFGFGKEEDSFPSGASGIVQVGDVIELLEFKPMPTFD
jgi:hypothetical protein